jgi:hypothetical protein
MNKHVPPVLFVLAVLPRPATADDDSRAPTILSADADTAVGLLFIHGRNLGNNTPPVRLGGTELTVVSSSPTDVVAELPADNGIRVDGAHQHPS